MKSTTTANRYKIDVSGLTETENQTSSSKAIVFVNTYIGKYCVAITKSWNDQANRDGVRPDGVIVELEYYGYPLKADGTYDTEGTQGWYTVKGIAPETQYKYTFGKEGLGDEETTVDTTTYVDYALLNEANNWTHMVKGVDKYDQAGNVIEYRWVEKALYFGKPTQTFVKAGNNYTNATSGVVVINAVTGTDSDGKPTSTFTFWYDADASTNKFSATDNGGDEIIYTGTVTGIDQKTNPDDKGTITYLTGLKNKHEITTTKVEATKKWVDRAGNTITPAAGTKVTFRLIGEYTVDVLDANGNVTGTKTYQVRNITQANSVAVSDIELDGTVDTKGEKTAWIATWENLPKYYNGHKIQYKVYEIEVPEGYTSTSATAETAVACELNNEGIWTATINNTIVKGQLKIDKNVIIDNKYIDGKVMDGTTEKTFYVVISKTVGTGDATKTLYVTNKTDGTLEEKALSALTLDSGVFALEFAAATTGENAASAHYNLTVTNLPEGVYTVQEVVNTAAEGATPVWEIVSPTNATKLNVGNTQFMEAISKTKDDAEITADGGSAEIINTYSNQKYCVAVTKQWLTNGKVSAEDDLVLYVKLQRTITPNDDASWTDVENIYLGEADHLGNPVTTTAPAGLANTETTTHKVIKLTKANNWSAVAVGMDQKDASGNRYSYRWVETNSAGSAAYTAGQTIIITGEKADGTAGNTYQYIVGRSETAQSTDKDGDGVKLIFLTKLVNEKASAQPEVTKALAGNTEAADPSESFTFTLAAVDGKLEDGTAVAQADVPMPSNTEISIKANQTGIFDEISYTNPGTYYYTITETGKTGTAATEGMNYDTTPRYVKVVVARDAEKNNILVATVNYGTTKAGATENSLTVTNTVQKVTAQPEVSKALKGNLEASNYDEEFTFTLAAVDGKLADGTDVAQTNVPMTADKTVTIKANATGAFGEITFTQAGTYYYTITESGKTGDAATEGMTYDTADKYVKIVVAPSATDPALKATVTYGESKESATAASLTVINTVQKVTAQPEVTKEVTGSGAGSAQIRDEEYTFTLAAVNNAPMPAAAGTTVTIKAGETGVFGEITYTQAGTYYYTITETAGTTTDMTYDTVAKYVKVVVAPTSDTDPTLTATVTYGASQAEATAESLTVTNTYEPETQTSVYKTWDDENNKDGKRPASVTAILYKNNKPTTATVTLYSKQQDTAPAAGKINVGGKEYDYTYSAWDATNGYTVTVTGLPKYENGDEIVWSWLEKTSDLPETYTMSDLAITVDANGASTVHITNTYNPDKFCLTVLKVWDDEGYSTLRPAEIEVELYRTTVTGTPTAADLQKVSFKTTATGSEDDKAELNKNNNWSVMALAVDKKNAEEKPYRYFWKEVTDLTDTGYTMKTDGVTGLVAITTGEGDAAVTEYYFPANEGTTRIGTVENTLERGKLTIVKKVNGLPADADVKNLHFTVTGYKDAAKTKKIFESQTVYLVRFTENPSGVFTYNQFTNLPLGYYEVTEDTTGVVVASYHLTGATVQVDEGAVTTLPLTNGNVAGEGAIAEITKDGITFTFENTYAHDTGDLSIHKTVVGALASDANAEFIFQVKLSDTTLTGPYEATIKTGSGEPTTVSGGISFSNGINKDIKLKADQTLTIKGLPTGVTYEVTETPAENFTRTNKEDDTGSIVKNTTPVAEFTNTRNTADLSVTKSVVSSLNSDKTKSFTVTVTLSDQTITGTYGDFSFTAGKAETTIKDGETKKAAGLPTGITYTVVETDNEGFTVTYGGETSVAGKAFTADTVLPIVNTKDEGSLKISKEVVSRIQADKESTKRFTFTITMKDADGNPASGIFTGTLTKPGQHGADLSRERKITFENGTATIDLAHNESMTISGIPAGYKYYVEETSDRDFSTEATNPGTAAEQLTIVKATTTDANNISSFKNTRKLANLIIDKTVVSDVPADQDATYTFRVRLLYQTQLANNTYVIEYYDTKDATTPTSTGNINFVEGEATVSIKAGGKAVIVGLPVGATFHVDENVPSGFTVDETITGTAADDTDKVILTATGVTDSFTNTRTEGGLKVTKTVHSDEASDLNKNFSFTVELFEADGTTPANLGITDPNGKAFGGMTFKTETEVVGDVTKVKRTYAEFTLHHDQNVEALKLPAGLWYRVTETSEQGFTTTYTGETGVIPATGSSVAAFTNTRAESGLIISKEVFSDLDNDKAKEFGFTLTLYRVGSPTTPMANEKFTGAVIKRGAGISTETPENLPTDANGQYHFNLKHGQILVIQHLPEGATFKVTEDEETNASSNFTVTKLGDSGTIRIGGANLAEFINTRKPSELTLKKVVTSPLDVDQARTFQFNVKLYDLTDSSAEDTESNRSYITATIAGRDFKGSAGADFYVQAGHELKLEGLPAGVHYIVTEVMTDIQSGRFTGTMENDQGVTVANAATPVKVTATNVRKLDDIVLSKTVVSPIAADQDTEFHYTIAFNRDLNGDFEAVPSDATKVGGTNWKTGQATASTYAVHFANGRAMITLKGGASVTIKGVPTQMTYTVFETPDSNFTPDKLEVTGTIQDKMAVGYEVATVAYTNTRKTGELEVTKTVSSPVDADKTADYNFTVEFDTVLTSIKVQKTGDTAATEVTPVAADGKCTYTFTLKNGEKLNITGLPTGVGYTVTESPTDGIAVTRTGDTGTISTVKAVAAFTNTRQNGGLVISKKVVSDVTADNDILFNYTLVLGEDVNHPASITGQYGDLYFQDGVAGTLTGSGASAVFTPGFQLKHGQTVTVSGLPIGVKYTVTENLTDEQNNIFTQTSEGRSSTFQNNVTASAAFTNTRKTGELEINKTVVSDNPADSGKLFTFTVELAVGTQKLSGTYSGYTFTNGAANITMHGGDTVRLTGIPVGADWTVTEAAADGFTTKVSENGATATDGNVANDKITATKSTAAFTNTRETGDLTVTKTVVSSLEADNNATYTFTIYLDADVHNYDTDGTTDLGYSVTGTGAASGETITFTNGVATLTVAGGKTKTIVGLPTGIAYTIVETSVDGMTTTVTKGSTTTDGNSTNGTIVKEGETVTFKNTRKTGWLTLNKNMFIDGKKVTNADATNWDREFYVKVKKLGNTVLWVTSDAGELDSDDTKAKVFTVRPSDTTKTIKGLPVGTYEIIEVKNANGDAYSEGESRNIGAMTFLADLSATDVTVEVGEYKKGTAAGGASQTPDIGAITEGLLVNSYTSGKFCIAVTKQWLIDGEVAEGPTLKVTLQRKLASEPDETTTGEGDSATTTSNWKDVEDQADIELKKENNWSYVAIGMKQMDENGVRYDYRWVEGDHDGWYEGKQVEKQTVNVPEGAADDEAEATLVVLTILKNSKVTAQPKIIKKVTGDTDAASYNADELFKFTLTAGDSTVNGVTGTSPMPDENTVIEIKGSATGVEGVFGEISYSEPGTYKYTIKETAGATPGMTYDTTTEVEVTVTVTKDGNGVLSATVAYDTTSNDIITNDYQVVTAQPEVSKEVKGNTDAATYDADEEFTFTLAAVDGAPMPADGTTVTVKAGDPAAKFGEILYTAAGTYQYTITETAGRTAGMTYDTAAKNVTVTVTKVDATGDLTAEVKYDGENSLTVTNTYAITTAQPEVTKKVAGDVQAPSYNKDELFKFTLAAGESTVNGETGTSPLPSENTEIEIKGSATGVKGVFGEITYTEAGTYNYTITETKGRTVGMTYDVDDEGNAVEHNVVVTVEADEDGALTATVTYDEEDALEVTNTYETGELKVTKTVTAYNVDGEVYSSAMPYSMDFLVSVQDEEGNYYSTNGENVGTDPHWVKISHNGEKIWEHLPFGTYTVTESETDAEVPGYTRVTKIYDVTVKPETEPATDSGDDADAEPTEEEKEESKTAELDKDAKSAEFSIENVYTPLTTSAAVIKVWNDNDDAAGKRADTTVMVQLLANNEPVDGYSFRMPSAEIPEGKTAEDVAPELPDGVDGAYSYDTEKDQWTLTINKLPQYVGGVYQSYSWIETINEGSEYTMTNIHTDMVDGIATTTITNTYDTDRYCLEVLKVWDDDNDRDDVRPDDITVTLMKLVDGEPVAFGDDELLDAEGKPIQKAYTLKEENHWTALATGLPMNDFDYVWVEGEFEKDDLYVLSTSTDKTGRITYLKNSYTVPGLEKKTKDVNDSTGNESGWQDSADYDIGDDVPFQLTAKLPGNVTDYTKYSLTFTDEMEDGLTFGEIESVYVGGRELGDTEYTLTSSAHGMVLELSWGNGEDLITDTSLNNAAVTVNYTAKLNDKAVLGKEGNANFVTLKYSNNPKDNSSFKTTEGDTVIVFTYGFEYTKVDDAGQAVEGAKFKLEKKLADGTTKEIALTTATNSFSAKGLDDGVYILTETKTPAGYQGIEPIVFTVTAKHEIVWNGEEATRGRVLQSLNGDVLSGDVEIETEDEQLTKLTTEIENKALVNVEIVKVWEDKEDKLKLRPTELTVALLADGEPALDAAGNPIKVTLTEANNWTAKIEKLPKYKAAETTETTEGTEGTDAAGDAAGDAAATTAATTAKIVYTWSEEAMPKGYVLVDTKVEGAKTTLTNAYLVPEVDKKTKDTNDTTGVTSDWQDSADYDIGDDVPFQVTAKLPESVTRFKKYDLTFTDTFEDGLTFKADSIVVKVGEETLDAAAYTLTPSATGFELKLSWGNGEELITDTSLNGATVTVNYTATLNDKAVLGQEGNANKMMLAYSNNPAKTDSYEETDGDSAIIFTYGLTFNKVDDGGKALTGAKFKLEKELADGTKVGIALTEAGNVFTAKGLDDGNYVLTEIGTPDGHVTIDPISFTVTADHKVEWRDSDDRTDILTGLNGDVAEGVIELKADDALANLTTDVVNVAETTTAVTKIWDDNQNAAKTRPAKITVKLLANNAVKQTFDLPTAWDATPPLVPEGYTGAYVYDEEKDTWTLTLSELPVYVDGVYQTYSWIEEAIGNNYSMSDLKIEGVVTTITNTYAIDRFCLTVYKVWDDENNQDNLRPESITVTLKKLVTTGEGDAAETKLEKVVAKDATGHDITTEDIELKDANNWTAMITSLPIYEDGKPITYVWVESGVPEGYTLVGAQTATDGTKYIIANEGDARIAALTNAHTPEKMKLAALKTWDDNNNVDSIRPTSITVTLIGTYTVNGTEKTFKVADAEKTMTAESEWAQAVWENLPVKQEGVKVDYSVVESDVDGYTTKYDPLTKNNNGTPNDESDDYWTITIINTHTPETVDIEAEKVWKNADGEDITAKIVNATVTFTLQKSTDDGVTWENAVTTEADNNAANPTVLTVGGSADANAWKVLWTDLPKNVNVTGQDGKVTSTAIKYQVVESDAKVNTDMTDEAMDVTPTDDDAKTEAVSFTENLGTATLVNTQPEADIELEAKKKFNGTMTAGQFAFELYATKSDFSIGEGAAAIQTKTNEADGSVTFDAITYTKPGSYYYVVKEAEGDDPTIVYDDKEVQVTVTVTYANGELKAEADKKIADLTFTNEQLGMLIIEKIVEGVQDADRIDSYEVTVKNSDGKWIKNTNGETSDTEVKLTVPADGTLEIGKLPLGAYTVTEKGTDAEGSAWIAGYTLDVTTENSPATISKDELEQTVTITNTYTEEPGSLKITKNVTIGGSTTTTTLADGTYTFTIKQNGAAITTGKVDGKELTNGQVKIEVKNGTAKTVTVTDLPAGIYIIHEEASDNGTVLVGENDVPVTVTHGDTTEAQTAEFTNDLKTGELEIDKRVFVDGADKTNSYDDKTFYVKVKGQINGVTYYVTSNNGEVSKTESDGTVFEIKPGTKLEITGLPVGTYTVTEVNSDGTAITDKPDTDMGSMTYLTDLSRKEDKAAVADGETAEASIVNAYTTGKYCVAVTKQWLVNKEAYTDDSLTITVSLLRKLSSEPESDYDYFDDAQKEIELNKSNNWSYVAVGMDQMDENGERYDYKWIEESVPEKWAEAQSELVQKTEKDETTLIFLTKLVNTQAKAQPAVTKEITGNTGYDAAEEFTFTLTAGESTINGVTGTSPMPTEDTTVTIKAGETGFFGTIVYNEAGTYEYKIKETKGSTNGMIYDETEHTVTVTVAADENTDVLTATVKYDETKDSLTVTNTFAITTAQPEVTKKVAGDVTAPSYNKDELFKFTLAAGKSTVNGATGTSPMPSENTEIEIKGSAAGVKGVFGEITYTEAGIYEYTITETKGATNGMTYDVDEDGNPVEHKVVVTVAADETTGALTATVKYDGDKDKLEVTNTFETGDLEISKEVVSPVKADQDKDFTFNIELSIELTGTYSGVDFAKGKAEVKVHGGESKTIKGLPTGITYTVTEANAPGFTLTGKTGDTGSITTTKAEAKFTNTRDKGDLKISKTVVSPIPAEQTKEYSFDIQLNEKVNGTFSGIEFKDGAAKGIKVKGGESKTIEGLPTGVTYTVTEAEEKLFKTTSTGATGTISATMAEAAFTNERKVGDLEVTKKVISSLSTDLSEEEFNFKVTLGDTTISGTFGDMEFDEGVYEFTLKDGEKATATGLPTNVSYTVQEATAEGFVPIKTGDTGTICLSKSIAAFTNVKSEGGLVVSKKVVSAITADHTRTYAIKVTLSDTTINDTYSGVTFENGETTLNLTDGEVKVIDGLPIGIKYTVTEELTEDDGKIYTVAYDGETVAEDEKSVSGNIEKDKTKLAQVTNTRKTTELTISKKVYSNIQADKDDEAFLFTLKLSAPITGVYSGVYIENGEAQLWLKHNQSITLKGIPYGTTYTVDEVDDARFTETHTGKETDTLTTEAATVAYTNTRKTASLKISKKLVSNVAADFTKEYTFLIQLSEPVNGEFSGVRFTNGTSAPVVIMGEGSKTIGGLPEGITYEIAEANVVNLTPDAAMKTGTLNGDTTVEFTNTHEETGKLTISKTVVSNNANDKDPKQKVFTFTITLEGVTGEAKSYTAAYTPERAEKNVTFTGGEAKITLGHDQSVTISGLPAGVKYTVAETEANQDNFVTTSKGEEGFIGATGTSTAAFTNTKAEGGLVVSKKVISAVEGDHANTRKFNITVTLADTSIKGTYGDASFDKGIAKLTLADGEVAVITGLPIGVGYEVTETLTDASFGEPAYSGNIGEKITKGQTKKVLVTNTRITKELTITKKVESKIASDKKEAFLFKVTLTPAVSGQYGGVYFKNGVAQIWVKDGAPITLAGIPYNTDYEVEEIDIPSRFILQETNPQTGKLTTENGSVTFTNKAEYVTLPVEKIWDDEGNEHMRPESIMAVLKADGETVATRTLNAGNGWKATASNLPKYKDGKEIKYTWEEGTVPEGYEGTVSGNTITNRLRTGDLVIRKTITGGGNVDFSNLTFQIVGPYGFDKTVKYSEFEKGEYKLTDLPIGDYVVYETNAARISFQLALKSNSVTAVKATVEDESETTAELKNNYERRTTGVMVMKVWEDMEDLDGSRPAQIVMRLNNGMTATLNAANNWMAEINNLPMYDANGNEIDYMWTEPPVRGYVLTSTITIGNATVFTNTHAPDLTTTSVTKIWDDSNNAAKLRPARLRVTLQPTGQTFYLSPANNWTVTVTDLPKYNGGTEINYTWSEQTVLGYTSQKKVVNGVTIFTNSFGTTPPPDIPGRPPRTPVYVVKDYETPLGVEVIINHVGDCFD